MGVKESRTIRQLLGYKEKTAGGIMTPEVTTVTEDMTVSEVIEFLRAEAAEHESIYYIYVVEDDRHLCRRHLAARPDHVRPRHARRATSSSATSSRCSPTTTRKTSPRR